MYLKIRKSELLWPLLFLFPVLLSVSSFVIDCVLDFNTAIDNVSYLWGYFIYYLFFRLWAFIPVIFLYVAIFTRSKQYSLGYKILFILLTSALYSLGFFTNDLSMFLHQYTDIKRVISYFTSSLTLTFIFEYFKSKK